MRPDFSSAHSLGLPGPVSGLVWASRARSRWRTRTALLARAVSRIAHVRAHAWDNFRERSRVTAIRFPKLRPLFGSHLPTTGE